MQYKSQTEATAAFSNWLEQVVDMIPEGQEFGQDYHGVMQKAGTAREDGINTYAQGMRNICILNDKPWGKASSV
jgi:hypothetical protein